MHLTSEGINELLGCDYLIADAYLDANNILIYPIGGLVGHLNLLYACCVQSVSFICVFV